MLKQCKWELKQQTKGNCVRCGKRRDCKSKRFCLKCLIKKRILERTRRGYRPWKLGGQGKPPYEF